MLFKILPRFNHFLLLQIDLHFWHSFSEIMAIHFVYYRLLHLQHCVRIWCQKQISLITKFFFFNISHTSSSALQSIYSQGRLYKLPAKVIQWLIFNKLLRSAFTQSIHLVRGLSLFLPPLCMQRSLCKDAYFLLFYLCKGHFITGLES